MTDDVAGKAYVEQFGLETFSRADNAVRASKASKQTADTFQASATFLDLLQIWGAIDPEITAKVKFAKYHALRIAKAVRAGEDPNLSNPAPESTLDEDLPPLDPNDAEVQMLDAQFKPRQPSVIEVPDEADGVQHNLARTSSLNQSLHPSRDTSMPPPSDRLERQPSVVEVPDDADRIQRSLAPQSSLNESLHPSRDPSVPRPPPNDVSPLHDPTAFYANQNGKPDISPMESAEDRKSSIGGNYFPRVPSPTAMSPNQLQASSSNMTLAPPHQPFNMSLPSAPSEPSLPPPPSSFAQQPTQPPPAPTHRHGHFLPQLGGPPQPGTIPPNFAPQAAPRQQQPIAPPQLRQSHGPVPPVPSSRGSASPIQYAQQPAPIATQQSAIASEVAEEKMMSAQKHARWAISALNFEDVPTAIRELRAALADLGG